MGVYVCLSLASQICKQYRVSHVGRGGSVWLQLLDRRKRCLNCSMRRGGRQLIVPGSVKGESHFIVQSLMLNMLPAAIQSAFEAEHVSLRLLFTCLVFLACSVNVRFRLGCFYQQRAVQGNICYGHVTQRRSQRCKRPHVFLTGNIFPKASCKVIKPADSLEFVIK